MPPLMKQHQSIDGLLGAAHYLAGLGFKVSPAKAIFYYWIKKGGCEFYVNRSGLIHFAQATKERLDKLN